MVWTSWAPMLALVAAGCCACSSGAATPAVTVTATATVTVTATPTPAATRTDGTGTVRESGVVTEVVDGDTIDVEGVGRIRLRGMDTPEVGECGFTPASRALTELVLNKQVDLVVPATGDTVDSYGRLLRYVEVNGRDAGLALIEAGLAVAKYDSRDGYGAHPREAEYIAADESSPPARSC